MVNFASRLKKRRWPSGLLGLFLTFNLLLVLLSFVHPVADADAYDPCAGDYPCYTTTACSRSEGTIHRCENACPGPNQGYCFANPGPDEQVKLSVSIGSLERTLDLGQYIQAVYRYGVGAAAVLAAVMIMIGGLQWLTSRGAGQADKAKKRITDATIGLFITIFAWFILNTINPALVMLQMPRIPMAQPQDFVRCDLFKMETACGVPFGVREKENAPEDGSETEKYEIAPSLDDPLLIATCIGASCRLAGSEDGVRTCQPIGENNTSQTCAGCGEGYSCLVCKMAGETCSGGIGQNTSCCGGVCGFPENSGFFQNIERWRAAIVGQDLSNYLNRPGVCTSGAHGDKAAVEAECHGGKLVNVSDYWSGMRTFFTGGNPSAATWAGGICTNGSVGAPCNEDSDCAGGNRCEDENGIHVCVPSVVGGYCGCEDDGPECTADQANCPHEDAECSKNTQRCQLKLGGPDRRIYYDEHYSTCSEDANCFGKFGEGFRCESVGFTKMCTDGRPGTMCSANSHCRKPDGSQGYCYTGAIWGQDETDTGICTAGEDGNGCDNDGDCQSGFCRDYAGLGKVCIGPYDISGMPCVPQGGSNNRGGCTEGLTCHPQGQVCVPAQ